MIKSCLSFFHNIFGVLKSIKPETATKTTAAKIELGKKKNSFVKNNKVNTIKVTEIMEANAVFAPAWLFTAVLENPPVTGYPLKNAAPKLAIPNPINS